MRLCRYLAVVSALVALSACGGGGGDGGSDSRSPGFSVSTTNVTFFSDASGAPPPAQTVQGSVTNVDANTVFLRVTHTSNAIESVQVQLTGPTAGQLTIFPLPRSSCSARKAGTSMRGADESLPNSPPFSPTRTPSSCEVRPGSPLNSSRPRPACAPSRERGLAWTTSTSMPPAPAGSW